MRRKVSLVEGWNPDEDQSVKEKGKVLANWAARYDSGIFLLLLVPQHTHTPADHLTIPRSIQSTHPKRDSRLSLLSHGSNWDGSSLANSLSLYFLNRILTEAKRGNGPFCEKRVLISQVDEDVIHFFSPSWRGHIRCHRFCALSSSLQLGTKSYVSLCHVRHQFRRFSAGAGGRDMRW
jgi:hypothetical protein